MSADAYLKLIEAERERLEHARILESENAALKNANEALHRKLDALEKRPAVVMAIAAADTLDRLPAVKRLLKWVARR